MIRGIYQYMTENCLTGGFFMGFLVMQSNILTRMW